MCPPIPARAPLSLSTLDTLKKAADSGQLPIIFLAAASGQLQKNCRSLRPLAQYFFSRSLAIGQGYDSSEQRQTPPFCTLLPCSFAWGAAAPDEGQTPPFSTRSTLLPCLFTWAAAPGEGQTPPFSTLSTLSTLFIHMGGSPRRGADTPLFYPFFLPCYFLFLFLFFNTNNTNRD